MLLDLTQYTILTMLQAALFGRNSDFSPDVDWDLVYQEARAQAIVPLLSSVLPDFVAPEKRKHWLLTASQQLIHYYNILEEQDRLVGLFREAGIPVLILKGCAAAVYYPDPSIRTMGDIDFIVPQDRFDEAIVFMKEQGYVWGEKDDNYQGERHVEFYRGDICFELHHHFSNDVFDMDSYIDEAFSQIEQGEVDGFSFPMPPVLCNGIVLLSHMCQHLRIKMGLRQVLDWMMYVDAVLDDTFWETTFRPAIEQYGMVKFAKVVTRMCQKYLGLSERITWCADADERLCDQVLESLMDSGNFAQKVGQSSDVETALNGMKRLGFISFLQMRGVTNWEAAEKHRWLRPFAWIYQIFRYLHLTFKRGVKAEEIRENAGRSGKFSGMLRELGLE